MNSDLKTLLIDCLASQASLDDLDPIFELIAAEINKREEEKSALEQQLKKTTDQLHETNFQLRSQALEYNATKAELEENIARQKALLDATPEAVFSFSSSGIIRKINKAARDFLGIHIDNVYQSSGKDTLKLMLAKLNNPEEFLTDVYKIDHDEFICLRGYLDLKDGRVIEYNSVPELRGTELSGRVWCLRDVTEIRKHQALLEYQAFHDNLTGLPNRLLILKTLQHAVQIAKRQKYRITIIFIDLDDFKKINDTAGHEAGDQLLIEVTNRVSSVLRESDVFGRLGGDEFVIILEGVKHQHDVNHVLERTLEVLSRPICICNQEYVISCSLGLSVFPFDGDGPEELIRKADMAMYQAKKQGKNTYHYFDESLERFAMYRLTMENQLREAIDHRQFVLAFQPRVSLHTEKMVGVEALIRWIKPNGEIIFPNHFIPLAEQIGLIRYITQWVLEAACQQLVEWSETALTSLSVSINVSALDIQDRKFLDYVLATLKKYPEVDGRLEFELTESVFLEEKRQVQNIVSKIRKFGVSFSIDDFGTGYSSFSYLQDLEIDLLKIDRCFVSNVQDNSRSAAIVRSIVDIGINLGMQVVAEGVENKYEVSFLRELGCHFCQGYYFAKPVCASEVLAMSERGELF